MEVLKNKKGIEISFGWIFAVIAGAFIIFLAVYVTVNMIAPSKYTYYTEIANQISGYLNPVVSGIAAAESPPPIKFSRETRVYSYCYPDDSLSPVFGRQTLAFSEESGIGEKWSAPGGNISIYNKYVFTNEIEQGREIYLSAMPFYLGFKVDDLVFMNSGQYCFITPPEIIANRVSVFNNVNSTDNIEGCSEDSKKVCFGFASTECDMVVESNDDYKTGYVIAGGNRTDFIGNLVYAAIFSSPDIYNCNIKRLGNKASEMAYIYLGKIDFAKMRGCNSEIEPYLAEIAGKAANVSTFADLKEIYGIAEAMDKLNEDADCPTY